MLQKDRHIDQWDRVQSLEIDHINGQLIFDRVQRQFSGERMVFSTNGNGTIGLMQKT